MNNRPPNPAPDPDQPSVASPRFWRYILIGFFFTVAPLWVTWLVFDFLLGILTSVGTPLLRAAGRVMHPFSETLAGCSIPPSRN